MKLLWIGIAGALGALARYGAGGLAQNVWGDAGFPWGTLVVNVSGCLVFGIAWSIAESRLSISSDVRTVVLVGFLGAFTTFSTFAFETAQLIRDGEWMRAGANAAMQNGLGIAAVFGGMALGRMW